MLASYARKAANSPRSPCFHATQRSPETKKTLREARKGCTFSNGSTPWDIVHYLPSRSYQGRLDLIAVKTALRYSRKSRYSFASQQIHVSLHELHARSPTKKSRPLTLLFTLTFSEQRHGAGYTNPFCSQLQQLSSQT